MQRISDALGASIIAAWPKGACMRSTVGTCARRGARTPGRWDETSSAPTRRSLRPAPGWGSAAPSSARRRRKQPPSTSSAASSSPPGSWSCCTTSSLLLTVMCWEFSSQGRPAARAGHIVSVQCARPLEMATRDSAAEDSAVRSCSTKWTCSGSSTKAFSTASATWRAHPSGEEGLTDEQKLSLWGKRRGGGCGKGACGARR